MNINGAAPDGTRKAVIVTSSGEVRTAEILTPGTPVNVAVGSVTAQSAAVTATRVRIVSTTNCYIAFGSNPTADTSSLLLAAGHPEIFTFTTGQKVACLRVTADGVLSIAPLS